MRNTGGGDGYQAGWGRYTGGGDGYQAGWGRYTGGDGPGWGGMGTRLGGKGAVQVGWASPNPPPRTNTRGTWMGWDGYQAGRDGY